MSQATQGLDVGNVSGANYRAYMNEALKQVATMSSGTTAPSNPQQQQLWFDTNNGRVKIYLGSTWIPYFLINSNTNTALGENALQNNTTGSRNVAVGGDALGLNTAGFSNTAVGVAALYRVNGSQNTAIGDAALNDMTTGSNNTAVGYYAGLLGYNLTTQSNQFILGNGAVAALRCAQGTITTFSDERDKTNITNIPFEATSFLNKLKPRKFEWNMRPKVGTKVGIKEIGFIAQEVEAVLNEEQIEIPKLLDIWVNHYKDEQTGETSELEIKSLAPGTLIPVLVKAIQELSARIEALESALAA